MPYPFLVVPRGETALPCRQTSSLINIVTYVEGDATILFAARLILASWPVEIAAFTGTAGALVARVKSADILAGVLIEKACPDRLFSILSPYAFCLRPFRRPLTRVSSPQFAMPLWTAGVGS